MRTAIAYYDLKHNPVTWNVFDFLLQAELWRAEQSVSRIVVKVLPGPEYGFRRDSLPPYGAPERRLWRDNIVMRMPLLLPSCGALAEMGDRPTHAKAPTIGLADYTVGFRWNVRAANANVYPFRAIPAQVGEALARFGGNYVTVTLRETGWWKGRTSNLADWIAVAHGLRERGYDVVFVRDAACADEPIEGFAIAPYASWLADDRAALYAGAVMNMGISNGPLWFAWFMGVPVMIFDLVHDDEPCAGAQTFTNAGLKPGTQLANARELQRLCWHKAEPAAVLRSFDEMRIADVVSAHARAA